MWNKQISLPIALTLIRLIASPIVLPFLIVYLLPYNISLINGILAFLFSLLGLTDFFDGYFARKYHQVTQNGAMLDHVADKFLLYSTLIALTTAHRLHFFWAIIWIGREFFIMALRQIALENNLNITVSTWGKLKTALQLTCLTYIIANPYYMHDDFMSFWNILELALLFAATMLSVGSAYNYFSLFIKSISRQNNL